MKMNPIALAAIASLFGLASTPARADYSTWNPTLAFSGFGTVGYVQTDTNMGLFAGVGQPSGAGTSGTFGVDTKLGGQVNASANDMLSTTVQVISRRNGHGNFKPTVEWAFVKAQVMPELAFRAGRIGLPIYMVSDYLNVNYSNLWIRPPSEVYAQVTASHFTGADAIYKETVNSTVLTAQVFYGPSTIHSASVVHADRQWGINATAEFDDGITLRVGTSKTKLTLDNARLQGLVRAIEQTPYASVGEDLAVDHKQAQFSAASISYDQDNWIASFEFSKRKTSSFFASTTGWAATVGYRLGKFTPYAVVSQIKRDSSNVNNTIPKTNPALAGLSGAVDGLIESQYLAQKNQSIGMRWDAFKNLDVKLQYDHIRPQSGAPGLFNRVEPGFGAAVNVYSAVIDFVF
jgi:hypothetical protein